ncbi:MAG TPA: N(4)-(beta-N-acetylglucosaminyl)-L-asparaginase [Verrucomicrobiae bacterium]|jgi:N4-(beta-N-acetylglucosaminyl)-L-asparaginase|nr:N(4)-(beta-N-acetylglucosaminyl)-L-asparaginase [Verrucomicrobiae bacterium]
MKFSRRDFIATTAVGSASLALDLQGQTKPDTAAIPSTKPKQPIIISAANGYEYLDRAYALLSRGGDTLDAVMQVITGPEDDPNDDSVGLGGLPNEDCVVELDACCMHGPTRMAGSVAAVREIKNVSLLSKAVMEHTGHVMLVGEGAQRFGFDMGFPRENLLTDRSRKIWLMWKETMSNKDWWGPGIASPKYKLPDENADQAELYEERQRRLEEMAAKLGIEPDFRAAAVERVLHPPTGTINCSALNVNGEISGATTTSGLAWKLAGRAGDSPIIGAGCYVDQDVGAAGATGNGEENIKVCGAHTIVENMRRGMSPQEAGMDALKRIVRNFNGDMRKMQYVDMSYYILRKDGAFAGVCMWSGPPNHLRRFAIHDGTRRYETAVALFQGKSIGWPPMPEMHLAPEQKK